MRLRSILSTAFALVLGLGITQGQEPFVRFQHGQGSQDAALQTAVAHFRAPGSDVEVVLYGVVHIADGTYYQAVQRDLDSYDVVLFEGVAPGKEDPGAGAKNLGEMQQAMGEMLGLTFQKDGIDYTHSNLVHADMNMDQLKEAMGGGSFNPLGQLLSEEQMAQMAPFMKMAAQFGKSMMEKNPAMRNRFKMQMAQQLATADLSAAMDKKMVDAILIERNKVAFSVLERQLAERKQGRIAIFYGAAHMPDLVERLAAKGYTQVSKRWMSAWEIGNGVPAEAEQAPAAVEQQPATTPSGARWF